MNGKKLVAIIVLLTVLATGILTPAPARAVDTWVYVVGGIALYVGFVVVGTILYKRSHSFTPLAEPPPDANDIEARKDVHFAQHCAQTSGNLTLVCW